MVVQVIQEIFVLLIKLIYFGFEALYKLFVPPVATSVKGEIVLVTGAGHGIGKELALQYAALGATVIAWDINEANNKNTVKEINEKGYPTAHAYVCNVARREDVFKTVDMVRKDVGEINIIVNNAGIMPTHSLLDHTEEEIERIFNINVLAHCWIIQAILPSMIKNKHGHIVALSSCAGIFGLVNLVPYCASKFAVRGLMEALENELEVLHPKCNVKLTTICPYIVETGLCKYPVIRFKSLTPTLHPKDVAASIINAQRTGTKITTLPSHFLYGHKILHNVPRKSRDAVLNFMSVYLKSDLNQS